MSNGVEVWETSIDSLDPLGGVTYHALSGELSTTNKFARHLRTAFSIVLIGGNAGEAAEAESPEEADILATSSALLEMASMAEESLSLLKAEEISSKDALEALTHGIDQGLRELVMTASRLPHIAPPVHWLDWVLRTTPVSGARDVLALRAKECARAAQILYTALALSQEDSNWAASEQ